MKNVKKVTNLILVIVFICITGFGFSNVFGQEKELPTLYAVMFYADGSDSTLALKVENLQKELESNKDVEFVKFDFSTKESKEETQKLADELGLSDVLTSNEGTGFVVLVDAKSKEEKVILIKESLDEMLAIIKKNLEPAINVY
jgi:hypothetical protein